MARILGIDLGTTNSVMAFWDGREPKIIANDEGARLTPSVVAFSPKGETLVGQVARRQAVTNADNTIYSIKRFIGRRFSEVTSEANRFPYQVQASPKGDALVAVRSQSFSPAQISAQVLAKLKASAEAFLGETVQDAVITVPAYFNDAQRQATKEAGELAGFNVRRIINEPTAAALAYGLDKNRDQTVAIYDFGGGTFDISILTVGDSVVEVMATHGDTHLGGDDIDQRIIAWMLAEFRSQTGIELNPDRMMLQRLKEASERAKIDLSSSDETEINLPFLALDPTGPKHLQAVLTRPELEDLIADLVERTLESCALALEDAGKSAPDIDEVVLVGGCSRIPLVQRAVRQFFGRDPRRTVNPDEVVALGAAVQAGVMSGQVKGLVLLDVTPLSLGLETHDGNTVVLVPRNTTIPTQVSRTFSTASDNQTTVEVHVVQGEAPVARDNRTLGRFDLEGIRAAPMGVPVIDVSFEIDVNGIVQVSARDRDTGKSHKISVTGMGPGGDAPPQKTPKVEAALRGGERILQEYGDRLDSISRAQIESSMMQLQGLVERRGSGAELQLAEEQLSQLTVRAMQGLFARPR